jgi:hypothetical protein
VNAAGLVMAGEAQVLTNLPNGQESTGARTGNYAKQSQFAAAKMIANFFVGKGL